MFCSFPCIDPLPSLLIPVGHRETSLVQPTRLVVTVPLPPLYLYTLVVLLPTPKEINILLPTVTVVPLTVLTVNISPLYLSLLNCSLSPGKIRVFAAREEVVVKVIALLVKEAVTPGI